MTSADLTNPPPVSGGSGALTPAVAGRALAGQTVAGLAELIKVGGLVRTESSTPLALTRADGDANVVPPSGAVYGDATYGDAVFGSNIANPAIYGKARYGQTLYGVASFAKIGGLIRVDHTTPIALTRTVGPDL